MKQLTSVLISAICITLIHSALLAQSFDSLWLVNPVLVGFDTFDYSAKGHESLFIAISNRKSGMVNIQGEQIIPFEYDALSILPSGWVEGSRNRKKMYFNFSGKNLSDAYEKCTILPGGDAIVFSGGKYGVIDQQGALLIPVVHDRYLQFGQRYVFFEGMEEREYIDPPARLFKNVQAALNTKAKALISDRYQVTIHQKTGFLDAKGDTVVPVIYQLGSIHPKGYLVASMEPGSYGIIDKNNKTLQYFTCDALGTWTTNGLIPVKENNLWSIRQYPGGKEIIQAGLYDQIEVFDKTKDWFIVKKKNKFGVINTQNEVLLPIHYDYVSPNNQLVISLITENQYGYWYIPSNTIKEPFCFNIQNMNDTLCVLNTAEGASVVNVKTGKVVIPSIQGILEKRGAFFIHAKDFQEFANDRYKCLYNLDGSVACRADSSLVEILPGNTLLVSPNRPGPEKVEHRNKYGQVLRSWPASSAFHSENCWIRLNENGAAVNTFFCCSDPIGKEVYYTQKPEFSENIYLVKQEKRCGFTDISGKTILPFVFEAAHPSKDGYVKVKYQGKWGVLKNPLFR